MNSNDFQIVPVRSASPVRAVVLDWGGVMSNAGRAGQVGENLAQALGIPADEGKRLVASADYELKRGLAGEDGFWRQIEALHGAPVPAHQRDIWIPAAQLAPHPAMVAEVAALREAGYLVGLLTNTHPAASAAVASIGGYEGFDAVVASNLSQTHSAKPQPEAYQEVLAALGVEPSAALFVDDQRKALDGAASIGMHVLQADPTSPAFPRDLQTGLHAELRRLNGRSLPAGAAEPTRGFASDRHASALDIGSELLGHRLGGQRTARAMALRRASGR